MPGPLDRNSYQTAPTADITAETLDLAGIIEEGDYSGDEAIKIYVPSVVPPVLARTRAQEAPKPSSPLPKAATICALIDRGIYRLKQHSEYDSLKKIRAHIVGDDALMGTDPEAWLELHNHLASWTFRIASDSPLIAWRVRCSDAWKMQVLGVGEEIGLALSPLACAALMRGLGDISVHPAYQDRLLAPMASLVQQIDRRIKIAERLITGVKGRVF